MAQPTAIIGRLVKKRIPHKWLIEVIAAFEAEGDDGDVENAPPRRRRRRRNSDVPLGRPRKDDPRSKKSAAKKAAAS